MLKLSGDDGNSGGGVGGGCVGEGGGGGDLGYGEARGLSAGQTWAG